MNARPLLAVVVLAACASPEASVRDVDGTRSLEPAAGDLRKTGVVRFPVACEGIAQEEFDAAVALLHSFFYEESRRRFTEMTDRAPQCAMAWWGVAMTWWHPLWAPPTKAEFEAGAAAADHAARIGGRSEWERGHIAAINAYYDSPEVPAAGPPAQTCHGARSDSSRAAAFSREMEAMHLAFEGDAETTAFYALSLLATAPPTDKSYKNQLAAAAILEKLRANHPDHPGVVHYLIHAYDYPTLAERGLSMARHYAEIAPWVPHALHMPSHVFTRLGMWSDAIASDLAAVDASRNYVARWHPGKTMADELHSLDYLTFAYLQTGRHDKAGAIVEALPDIREVHPKADMPAAHALAAIPVRHVLERRRWKEAAGLELKAGPDLVRAFPFAEAHVEFAHAVGAGHLRDAAAARRAAERLTALRDVATERKLAFWVSQIEIQRLAASGWLAHAEGNDDEAVKKLRESAELEESAGTHPVTPGALLPAREQLGDLLLEMNRPADALPEYELALASFPHRFNAHYGAGRSAQLTGNREKAREHYAQLLAMAEGGDGSREEVSVARAFLNGAR